MLEFRLHAMSVTTVKSAEYLIPKRDILNGVLEKMLDLLNSVASIIDDAEVGQVIVRLPRLEELAMSKLFSSQQSLFAVYKEFGSVLKEKTATLDSTRLLINELNASYKEDAQKVQQQLIRSIRSTTILLSVKNSSTQLNMIKRITASPLFQQKLHFSMMTALQNQQNSMRMAIQQKKLLLII